MIKCDFDFYGIDVSNGFARINSISIGNGDYSESPDSEKKVTAYYSLFTSEMSQLPTVSRVTFTMISGSCPFTEAYNLIASQYKNSELV